MQFQRNISLLLGIMEARRRVEFTGVELAGGAELTALEEKAVAGGPVEKVVLGLHTMRVKCELYVGKFLPGRCELHTGEFRPSHGELGRRSTRCARVDSARAAMNCTRASSTPAVVSWAASTLAEISAGANAEHGMSSGDRGEHRMSTGGLRPGRPRRAA
jgi:hypothetical protein